MKLVALFVLAGVCAWATPELSKKEKKGCLTCHVKMKDKELNDAGKYYKEKKTLEGFKK